MINNLTTKFYLLLAQGSSDYTKSITNLEQVMTKVSAAIGVIMLAYGGIKFALAFQKMDQQGEHQAVFSVVSGAILIGLAGVISALK
ncbi:MAG: hypothetical protein K6D38_09685 [Pseudobutyrivibrio sp.]|nr:hypothetical protein [Pseudobutyrivibrio sp.]